MPFKKCHNHILMHILMQKSAPPTLYGFFGQDTLRKPTKLYRMKLQTEVTFNRFFIIFHRYFLLKRWKHVRF